MTDPRVYRIWDTVMCCWWATPSGKTVWTGVDTAMASWNNCRSPFCAEPVFSRQRRYEIRAFSITCLEGGKK